MSAEKVSRRRVMVVTAGITAVAAAGFIGGRLIGETSRPLPAQAEPLEADPTVGDGAGGGVDDSDSTLDVELSEGPDFPVNENGQTYGVALNLESREYAPDLIAVEMSDGQIAFILADDLFVYMAVEVDDPQEAAAATERMKGRRTAVNKAGVSYVPITAYESDGETVVGTWEGLNQG